MNQSILNENFNFAARMGDLAEVINLLDGGVDILARDDVGWYALWHAVENGHEQMAEYLLEQGFKDFPELVGFALILAATPAMVKLLVRYNPDCYVTNDFGMTARDLMVNCGEYESIAIYDESGLPKPPLNLKLLRGIKRRCCLDRWSALMGIAVPAELRHRLDRLIQDYPYDLKKHKREFLKITDEVSKSA
ncbi:ankyrin repeat domain-containing protein [Sporomusa sphaeroides]|uniref:Ankyrin repeats (3 copies) n=1 Tax=Sporomusa sphaeroides DSM 2875 TaxID=1337886 RepID=A0ABM9VZU2_9FIRM|nr:ankyrin repeat domain-containing protein [Sporomusa sphaeroides]OLS56311.1 ankyrin repeats (3 copies) [Sporomusa sphaeroides DSM 2875]CVK18406.1 Ankyrin repeats (3 copies) [Sporomusa sphaeroides DSM 2875]